MTGTQKVVLLMLAEHGRYPLNRHSRILPKRGFAVVVDGELAPTRSGILWLRKDLEKKVKEAIRVHGQPLPQHLADEYTRRSEILNRWST